MKINNSFTNHFAFKSKSIHHKSPTIKQVASFDTINFSGLMKDKDKEKIKMCVYDLDHTLLQGQQADREKVFEFSKNNNHILVYSTGRPIQQVIPKITSGTLASPHYIVCNDGLHLYKRNKKNNSYQEIIGWSQNVGKNFDRDTVREVVSNIAKKYPLENDKLELLKEEYPNFVDGNTDSIKSFSIFKNPLQAYFIVTPEAFTKALPEIEKELDNLGMEFQIHYQHNPKGRSTKEALEKFIPEKMLDEAHSMFLPRYRENGGVDMVIISPKSDKGRATEFLREQFRLESHEVFAAGDAENDLSHTDKGYFFALLSNATERFKELAGGRKNVIPTTQEGAKGIFEVIE